MSLAPFPFFDNNDSRGLFKDGWFASTFGPLTPWLTVSPGLATWDSSEDVWELYDLRGDFYQAENLADREPERLAAMKTEFLKVAEANKAFPIGAGIWLRIHPEDRIKTPYTLWQFDATTTRMPEFTGGKKGTDHVFYNASSPCSSASISFSLKFLTSTCTFLMQISQLGNFMVRRFAYI